MGIEAEELRALVDRAVAGDRGALEAVVVAIKDDLYNLAMRMLGNRAEAEDATQEILIQVVTHLAQWRGDASLRTWTWRIAVRHLMRMKRGRLEEIVTLELGAQAVALGASNPPLPRLTETELQRLANEVRLSCTQGMLTSLDRDQRISFILAELFELDSTQAADVLDIDAATHRKRVQRARSRLGEWMGRHCGIVDPANPCRCRRQIPVAIAHGFIDPDALPLTSHAERRDPRRRLPVLDAGEQLELAVHTICNHPDYQAPDSLVARIRALLETSDLELLS